MDRKEFVDNFKKFYLQMREANIDATVQEATALYAIYRKDLRTKTLNGGKFASKEAVAETPQEEQPASEKQKRYLMDLAYEKGVCITQRELDRMTREEASKTIDTLLGRD